MSKLKKLLGKRIKDARKAKGLTQDQLAKMLGIGTSNISYMETGKFAPSIENFEKLVEILGVEPYELYMFKTMYFSVNQMNQYFSGKILSQLMNINIWLK